MGINETQKKNTEEFRSGWDRIFSKPKRKMIDPPEGWRYGFPKEIPEDVDDTKAWLIANGYPEEEINKLGESFYVRGWYEEEK